MGHSKVSPVLWSNAPTYFASADSSLPGAIQQYSTLQMKKTSEEKASVAGKPGSKRFLSDSHPTHLCHSQMHSVNSLQHTHRLYNAWLLQMQARSLTAATLAIWSHVAHVPRSPLDPNRQTNDSLLMTFSEWQHSTEYSVSTNLNKSKHCFPTHLTWCCQPKLHSVPRLHPDACCLYRPYRIRLSHMTTARIPPAAAHPLERWWRESSLAGTTKKM